MGRKYSNTAVQTTLSSGITAAATTITVASTTGFPAVDFVLALEPGTGNQELVLVTNVAGTTLTVTRGYDSTTAVAHSAGAVVEHSHAAIDFRESRDHEAATAAHGATGAVVGTSNTQTLTNKTLQAAKIDDLRDTNGNSILTTLATASAVNNVRVANNVAGSAPEVAAVGSDANIDLTLTPKGTGKVKTGGSEVATLAATQTLTNKTLSTGTKVGAATTDISAAFAAYTPTFTNLTLGNGTVSAFYMQIGKLVIYRGLITLGTTSSFSGTLQISLPANAVDSTAGRALGGNVDLLDTSASARRYWVPRVASASTFHIVDASNTAVGTNTPWTWADTDTIDWLMVYEAA